VCSARPSGGRETFMENAAAATICMYYGKRALAFHSERRRTH